MQASKVLVLADSSSQLTGTLCAILESSSAPRIELQKERLESLDAASHERGISRLILRSNPQLILLAISSHASASAETLVRVIKRAAPELPLMAVIESCQPDETFRLLESGVLDFITTPLREAEVLPRLWRILERTDRAPSLNETLKEKLGLRQLVGTSPSFISEIKKIPLVAKCDASILISGETGTGKEVCARAIHYLSLRAGKSLIPVNCGAIPLELVENELFGHERGAFTGAVRSQPGLIEEADGGTLFLDEIDCLPTPAQVKLLRFIQEKEYRPLGSTKLRKADVRVISATNCVIEDAVREGRFRQDLFFRLNIIPIKLPPLRERREDIPLLAEHFLARYATEFKKQVRGFSPEAMRSLTLYDWPGNVRELEYIVERAVVLTEQPVIDRVDVEGTGRDADAVQDSFQEAKAKMITNFERAYINNLLLAHKGNVTRAAQAARKNRRAFLQLIRKHGIDARRFRLQTLST